MERKKPSTITVELVAVTIITTFTKSYRVKKQLV